MRGPEPRITDVRRGLPFAKKLLRIEVGPIWIVGEVADAQELAALKPDMGALAAFTIDHEATGITVFAPSGEKQTAMHVRSFAPAHGIPEDPVCGTGNLAVAHYLKQTNSLKRFGERYIARQGMQMRRDGRVHVRVDEDGVRIGGRAVTCIGGHAADLGRRGRARRSAAGSRRARGRAAAAPRSSRRRPGRSARAKVAAIGARRGYQVSSRSTERTPRSDTGTTGMPACAATWNAPARNGIRPLWRISVPSGKTISETPSLAGLHQLRRRARRCAARRSARRTPRPVPSPARG